MTETDSATLRFLLVRRSVSELTEPAPSDAQLDAILTAATTVPDHGALRPYRFVVVRSEGRIRFGDALASAMAEARPDVPPDAFAKVRHKAFKAPLLVVLVASPKPDNKIQDWEQRATAACTGYAMVLAAAALGLGAVWKSSPYVAGRALNALLALQPGEHILGWVNLGTPQTDQAPATRPPAALHELVTVIS